MNVLFWIIGIINAALWLFALLINLSHDRSGAGMVLMVLLPFNILIGLISLIIIGFAT